MIKNKNKAVKALTLSSSSISDSFRSIALLSRFSSSDSEFFVVYNMIFFFFLELFKRFKNNISVSIFTAFVNRSTAALAPIKSSSFFLSRTLSLSLLSLNKRR